jgi:hypothetical protein
MNVDERVRQLQTQLNEFTSRFLEGVNPIIEDGVTGPATEGRVTLVKVFLGYPTPSRVSDERLLNAVAHVTALAGRTVVRDQGACASSPRLVRAPLTSAAPR